MASHFNWLKEKYRCWKCGSCYKPTPRKIHNEKIRQSILKLRDSGVQIGRPKFSEAQRKRVFSLKKEDRSIEYISKELGMSKATVYRILSRESE